MAADMRRHTLWPMYLVANKKRKGPKRAAVNQQLDHAVQDSQVGKNNEKAVVNPNDLGISKLGQTN